MNISTSADDLDGLVKTTHGQPETTMVQHEHTGLVNFSQYLLSNEHSYISVTICLIGLVMNVVTMIVLIQKNMRSPTNLLLGSISVADMITILVYTPKLIVSTAFPLRSKSMEFAYYKLVSHYTLLYLYLLLKSWI